MLTQYRNDNIETLYTLEDARQIIKAENIARRREKQRQEQRKKELALYYLKQKISGVVMVAVGIITPFLLDGDATSSLITLPFGIYLMVTKSRVMDF